MTLHNSLIVSLFDTSAHLAPPTPPPEAPKPPLRKRKRTLPYQGEDDDVATLRSTRLKQWTIGMGRRERERFRLLENAALSTERRPRKDRDEIAAERGVVLLPERGGVSWLYALSSQLTITFITRTSWESFAPSPCFSHSRPNTTTYI